ncbi:hypothetical protein MJ390_16200 [Klebsiella pneumoniae]|nr:hypothetical protein MJ390_16200 [Klebsiella pneumoniae]
MRGGCAREITFALTAKGHDTVAKINAWGTCQVVEALDHLDETQQQTVATGLAAYARALAQCRDSALADTAPQIALMTGYQPGMIVMDSPDARGVLRPSS